MHDFIQYAQLVCWLIPVFVVLFVFSVKSGRPWNFILCGYVFECLRVGMKFLPWYQSVPAFKAGRFWVGILAIVLIAVGFRDFYVKTRMADSNDNPRSPFILAAAGILAGVVYFCLSPPVTKLFITHLRNVEDVVTILCSISIIAVIYSLRDLLSGLPLYTGFKVLALVFIAAILWKGLGFQLRAFEFKALYPENYVFWHNIQEGLEALVGFGFGGTFLFIFAKLRLSKSNE